MQRVMIIGGPGAGKSWLAREMARRLDLPVIAIDDFVWRTDGSLRAADEIDADAQQAATGAKWIIEGGNSRTYEARLARADMLVRLNPPRLIRIWRVMRRSGLRWKLLKWAWRYDAVFGVRDKAAADAVRAGAQMFELRSSRAVADFLRELGKPL